MKLTKRLEAIASFVSLNGRIIDVGANHAYLDLYFALKKYPYEIIATDIRSQSLLEAEKNIKKYHLEEKIQLIVTPGLEGILLQKEDNIILAGMGTKTIKEILTKEVLQHGNHFIIQSNNYLYELRYYMMQQGFSIQNEKVVEEKKKYYVIIDFIKEKTEYTKIELTYGPKLIKSGHVDYFQYLYKMKQKSIEKIPKAKVDVRRKKEQELEDIKKIRDMLI